MLEPPETQDEILAFCIKCLDSDQKEKLTRCYQKGKDKLLQFAKAAKDTTLAARIITEFNRENLWIHRRCRETFFNEKKSSNREMEKFKKDSCPPPVRTRSASAASVSSTTSASSSIDVIIDFDYRLCCLYCGVQICEEVEGKRIQPLPVMSLSQTLSHRKQTPNVSFIESKDLFDKTIKEQLKGREDDWACEVRGRVESVSDLRAADACYHRSCYQLFSMKRKRPGCETSSSEPKKPKLTEQAKAFRRVLDYIHENQDDQYWTCGELLTKMAEFTDNVYGAKYLLNKLEEECGANIRIVRSSNKHHTSLVYFNQTADSILQKHYQQETRGDSAEEKKKIIKLAVDLIKSDIADISHDKNKHFAFSDLDRDTALAMLPESLLQLLEAFTPRRSKNKDITLVYVTLGQALVQLARPNTIVAPLQLALGAEVHHKTGSKFVVEMLHKMGLCKSHAQVTEFARDLIFHDMSGYSKLHEVPLYAADNADVNNRTLDGKNTLHMMGQIKCILSDDSSCQMLDRIKIKKVNATDAAIRAKAIPFKFISKVEKTKITVDLKGLATFSSSVGIFKSVTNLDFLRIAAKLTRPVPEFSGNMKLLTRQNIHPGKHNVVFLPFINMNPSDSSTIYTTLCFMQDMCERENTKCVVTFDQPLWLKAMMVKNLYSYLKNITILKGNFHTMMSFHACIGFLMKNTGLKELLSTVYGELSVEAILKGKAYERAVRCHDLLSTVLKSIVMKQIPDEEKHTREAATELYESYKEDDTPTNILQDNPIISALVDAFNSIREQLSKSETNMLWLQYVDMVDIFNTNLAAERTGNWKMYLKSIHMMLPFFAAAGRTNYTKSLYWFLQEMEENLDEELREAFEDGQFVARLTDNHWAGISPDRAIESTLMAGLKGSTGLTRGRGLTEMTQLVWTLSRPAIIKLDLKMKELTGCRHSTSDQHEVKQARSSAVERNTKDMVKFEEFCTARFILNIESMAVMSTELRNVASGLIAPANVSIHKAEEIGKKILISMEGLNPLTLTLKKTDRVVQMPAAYSVKAVSSSIDSDVIFQRLVSVCTEAEVEEAFTFDLAHFPSSLFKDNGTLRTVTKSDLATVLKVTTVSGVEPANLKIVLDGGMLFYTVPWEKGKTYRDVIQSYLSYMKVHFPDPEETYIIFDGYLQPSTKDMVHDIRNPVTSLEIDVTVDNVVDCKRELILSNAINKHRFIGLLMTGLQQEGYNVSQCAADADPYFVQKAMELSQSSHVCVVAEDTDILIMMLHHFREPKHCVYLRQSLTDSRKMIDIGYLGGALPETTVDSLLLCHAMSGCDTTSGFFGFGKTRLFKSKMLEKMPTCRAEFYCRQETVDRVVEAGAKIMVAMYVTKPTDSTLDKLRHKLFLSSLHKKKGPVQKKVDHRRLPPTSSAGKYHSLRVYHQVQEWLFNPLDPSEYGWILNSGGKYEPKYTDKAVAPPTLLKSVSCACKTDCSSMRCGCKQLDFRCSEYCGCGDNCENQTPTTNQEEETEEADEDQDNTEDVEG